MKALRLHADFLDPLSRHVGRLANASLCDFDDFLANSSASGSPRSTIVRKLPHRRSSSGRSLLAPLQQAIMVMGQS